MVHALEKIRSFLRPHGVLLNIHDLPRPAQIEVHTPDSQTFAGFLLSHTDFENQRLADEALAQAVENGSFSSVEVHYFNYPIQADTLSDLEELLADSWENSYLQVGTKERISDLLSSAGDRGEIVLRLTARLSILIPTAATG